MEDIQFIKNIPVCIQASSLIDCFLFSISNFLFCVITLHPWNLGAAELARQLKTKMESADQIQVPAELV